MEATPPTTTSDGVGVGAAASSVPNFAADVDLPPFPSPSPSPVEPSAPTTDPVSASSSSTTPDLPAPPLAIPSPPSHADASSTTAAPRWLALPMAIDLSGLSDSDSSPAPGQAALWDGGNGGGGARQQVEADGVVGGVHGGSGGSGGDRVRGDDESGDIISPSDGAPHSSTLAAPLSLASLSTSTQPAQQAAGSARPAGGASIVEVNDSGSDSGDDFTITASTGPTHPAPAHPRRRMMPGHGPAAAARTHPGGRATGSLQNNNSHGHGGFNGHRQQHTSTLDNRARSTFHAPSTISHPSLPHISSSSSSSSASLSLIAAQQAKAALARQPFPSSTNGAGGFGQFVRRAPTNFATTTTGTSTGGAFPSHGAQQPGPSNSTMSWHNGDGSSAAPIDVEQVAAALSSSPVKHHNPKKPICIGAFQTRALMLYPKDAVTAGVECPPDSPERWEVEPVQGVEMLRVKLKLRKAGSMPRPDEPWSPPIRDTVQVLTPGFTQYIGDLDENMNDILVPMLTRGLCRMEGWAVRLQPEEQQFQCRLSVLMFTLPSNVRYIADTLIAHHIFLLDPVPRYEAWRYSDEPEYHNAHGGGDRAQTLYNAYNNQQRNASRPGMLYTSAMDKAKQVEVQRKNVELVFDSFSDGVELEQSDPGPWISTELFPHQRQALTFLLQGEQDWASLKAARKNNDKHFARKIKQEAKGSNEVTPAVTPAPSEGDGAGTPRGRSGKGSDSARSLWTPVDDASGRIKVWKNKITGEKVRMRKSGDKPKEAKGSILADDMGLGKTLSVVSLIAATHRAAKEWGDKKLEPVTLAPGADGNKMSELPSSTMMTKVYGMPDGDDDSKSSSKSKKRRRDEPEVADAAYAARRAIIVKRSKATLLVCPMSTITNWEDQIKEHWDGRVEVVGGVGNQVPKTEKKNPAEDGLDPDWDILRVYIYHGTSRKMDPRFLAEFDIVITSYSTLANEYSKQCACDDATPGETGTNTDDDANGGGESSAAKTPASGGDGDFKPAELSEALRMSKKQKPRKRGVTGASSADQTSPLQAIDWFRVVLDEAHSIKSSATVACKASCNLEADRRVALTGTPIQNKIEDVWALFKFLRISPIDDKDVFNKFITGPCKIGDQAGVARLQLVMATCTLRRTKDTVQDNGKKILDLPPRKELQWWIDLREDERTIYDGRLGDIKTDIQNLVAKKQLTKNYAHVLQQLLILRQTCDHIDLAAAGASEEDYDGTIMDFDVAVKGVEEYGLNMARAQSIVCGLKDADEASCVECGNDFGKYFPSLIAFGDDGLGGPKPEADEVVKKGTKKGATHPVLTKCQHILCQGCFKRSVYTAWPKKLAGVSRQCAKCQAMLRLDKDAIEVVPPSEEQDKDAGDAPKKVVQRKKWVRKPGEALNLSSKMVFLYGELMRFSKMNRYSSNYDPWSREAPREDGSDDDEIELDEDGIPIPVKSIVFSQWTTMLDRIEDMLQELKIGYCRLDGTMTREQRAEAMEALRTKKSVEVMLVSTRAGGVGLNLTAASRCYLFDPYWNPSVEAQAIDRIHRMGQKRPVTAIKLLVKDSVELKLLAIQQKKDDLAKMSLKPMTRKEIMEKRSDEIAELFS